MNYSRFGSLCVGELGVDAAYLFIAGVRRKGVDESSPGK